MGLFSQEITLFESFEKRRLDIKFLNIHLHEKNIKFYRIDENKYIYHSFDYIFFLKKKQIRFEVKKVVLRSNEQIRKRYFTHNQKLIRKKNSNIGFPNLDQEYADVIEFKSYIYKNLWNEIEDEYLNISSLRQSDWDKDIIKDFDIVTDRIIKKTIKKIK